jgi:hypothetical protein
MNNTRIFWPELTFQAINLWNAPSVAPDEEECRHTNWARYPSINMNVNGVLERGVRRCIDCGEYRPIENYFPVHQR